MIRQLTLNNVIALVVRGLRHEVRGYAAVIRWVTRRAALPNSPLPVRTFSYGRMIAPMLWLWVGASAAEVVVVHVLLPWRTAQTIALVLGVWGLLWMVGLLAGYRMYPHLLDAEDLVVRHGPHLTIAVPYSSIREVRMRTETLPSSARAFQPLSDRDGLTLRVGVSGSTNVHVVLDEPTLLVTSRGPQRAVAVDFYVDDPRDVIAQLRTRCEAKNDRTPGPVATRPQ